jgi:hypothetical protein
LNVSIHDAPAATWTETVFPEYEIVRPQGDNCDLMCYLAVVKIVRRH